jgi:membrane-anchored protein YejM (alkaline phosphatase superfamily)
MGYMPVVTSSLLCLWGLSGIVIAFVSPEVRMGGSSFILLIISMAAVAVTSFVYTRWTLIGKTKWQAIV